jgi:hypothetical protein
MCGWMDRQMFVWMDLCMIRRMCGWRLTDGRETDGWVDCSMGEWTDGVLDEWIERWLDGWIWEVVGWVVGWVV